MATIDDCKKLRPDFNLAEGRFVHGTLHATWTYQDMKYELYGSDAAPLLEHCHRGMVALDMVIGAVDEANRSIARAPKGSLKGRPWLQTSKGRAWCADDPESFPYDIEEFAHALSNMCRFFGHVRNFYSVAQHSVLVADVVLNSLPDIDGLDADRLCRAALLHDAAEAFWGDMASPLKRLPEMAGYRALLARTEIAIANHFGVLDFLDHPSIKRADLVLLGTEKRDCRDPSEYDNQWSDLPSPIPATIVPMTPWLAERYFLDAWAKFGGTR